ncbi:MAG: 3'-5' exoribonuclease [Bacteroidota bacterium]
MDTEFTGLHQQTTLISIGLVTDQQESFYAEFTDYDPEQVGDWIQANVIEQLQFQEKPNNYFEKIADKHWRVKGNTAWIKTYLIDFLSAFEAVEIWADNLAYDWVLFCQLFGHGLNIPKQVHYIPFDLSTLFKVKGIDPDIKREDFVAEELSLEDVANKHNALWDATIIRLCFYKANKL